MSSNLQVATEAEREGALQRLGAMVGLAVLALRAAWALIRWGN